MGQKKLSVRKRAQARAAKKRAARSCSSTRKKSPAVKVSDPNRSDAMAKPGLQIHLHHQREISDDEDEFVGQVLGLNAAAISQISGVKREDAKLILDELVKAGTIKLQENLHISSKKPLLELEK